MFPYLGLKASTDLAQIKNRLQYNPQVFEFYTDTHDLTSDGLIHLADMIDLVKAHGIHQIVIHHPMKYQQIHNEMFADATKATAEYNFLMSGSEKLIQLAIKHDVQVLLHGSYNEPISYIKTFYPSVTAARNLVFKRLAYFQSLGGDHVMFENSISPVFPFGDSTIDQRIFQANLRLCFDISHGFIYLHGNNQRLQTSLQRLAPHIVHYHLVDSMGKTHDSLPLGQGKIDWAALLPHLNVQATNIFEINLKNQLDCQEMLDSYQYLQHVTTAN
ncbi:sugar phosphate isomerase/epimerase [Lactobacillus sp. CC-MHH1034]|uniref:TIM barrel protein n=1 Tax=Agrilactobacillus fermenti TaxID=2586909 RepID=UPI001E2F12EB|nr:TIM barrel protein [Agrilactobacillus fermenti]MCD2256713.1 sugar phosphate isomerase/epimerase [Agrilactobacillus fermenti]